jgi:hypothetical protein
VLIVPLLVSRPYTRRAFVTLALSSTLLGGCVPIVAVPLAPDHADQSAKRFVAPPDAALLYLLPATGRYCNSRYLSHTFFFNGQLVGTIALETYYRLTVPPGRHLLMVMGIHNHFTQELVIEAGTQRFFQVQGAPGCYWIHFAVEIAERDPAEGRDAVQAYRLADSPHPLARAE